MHSGKLGKSKNLTSTGVVGGLLETQIKSHLTLVIAEKYRLNSNTYGSMEAQNTCFSVEGDHKSIFWYLQNLVKTLGRITSTTLLHMTIVANTYFRLNSDTTPGERTCYGLILASLYLTHHFNDDDKSCHQELEFANAANVDVDQLRAMNAAFLSAIHNQLRYSVAEYQAAWDAVFPKYDSGLPKELTEIKHEMPKVIGQPSALKPAREKEIIEVLIRNMAKVFQELMKDGYSCLPDEIYEVSGPFYSKAPPTVPLEEYLTRMHQYTHASLATFIHMTIIIDQYLEQYPNERFGKLNAHRLLLASFTLAHHFFEDKLETDTHIAILGGVPRENLIYMANRLRMAITVHHEADIDCDADGGYLDWGRLKNKRIPADDSFVWSPGKYEEYVRRLLPDYAEELGVPMNVVPLVTALPAEVGTEEQAFKRSFGCPG